MKGEYLKPLPRMTKENEPYWEAAKASKLFLQRCHKCDYKIMYPRSLCPKCGSTELHWFEAKGTGEIFSYTIVHRSRPEFKDDIPYLIVIVRLTEGPLLISNLIHYKEGQMRIGQKVKVTYNRVTDDVTIPKFVPV